jgi:hypothetical protein
LARLVNGRKKKAGLKNKVVSGKRMFTHWVSKQQTANGKQASLAEGAVVKIISASLAVCCLPRTPTDHKTKLP